MASKPFPTEGFDLLLPGRIQLQALVEMDPELSDDFRAIAVWPKDEWIPERTPAPHIDVERLSASHVDDGRLRHRIRIPRLPSLRPEEWYPRQDSNLQLPL